MRVPRPTTVHGLLGVWIGLQMRAAGPRLRGGAAVLVALSALGLARARAGRARPAVADATRAAFQRPPTGQDTSLDPAVVATPAGWVVAWTRWPSGTTAPGILVRTLRADGAPADAPRRLSVEGTSARFATFARCGGRLGVAWASSEDDARWPVFPWFAVIDDAARDVVRPRRVGDEESRQPSLACDGDGWVLGSGVFGSPYRVTRFGADGASRGPAVTLPALGDAFGPSALTSLGDLWVVGESRHDRPRARSAVTLRWVDRDGRVLARHDTAWVDGHTGPLAWSARGATAWATFGADMGFELRHAPWGMRVEGRTVAVPARPMAPRRTADVPTLSCDGASCVAAWSEAAGGEPARLRVQALGADGAPRGPARVVGPAARLQPWGRVALARSLDERALLAVWVVDDAAGPALLAVPLTPEGAPAGPLRRVDR
ncbi:MAG: hypothetical protein U0325_15790 [Polyangiales bacterium]